MLPIMPLLNDLRLVVDWNVFGGDAPFFQATKAMCTFLRWATTLLMLPADYRFRFLASS